MPNLKGQVKHQKPNQGFYKHNLDLKTNSYPNLRDGVTFKCKLNLKLNLYTKPNLRVSLKHIIYLTSSPKFRDS